MTESWLTPEESEALKAPFPAEALMKVQKGRTLTSVKAGFVIERVHKVFGHGNVAVDGTLRVDSVKSVWLNQKDAKAPPVVGAKPFVQFHGRIRIYGKDRAIRAELPVFGLRTLDSHMDWEDTAKSCRTNAISKSLFENLLVGLDVFKGYVEWDGNNVVTRDPEEEEAAKNLEQAAIQRRRLLKEMQDFGKSGQENLAGIKKLVVDFRGKHKLEFAKIEELDAVWMSRLYFDFQANLLNNGKADAK